MSVRWAFGGAVCRPTCPRRATAATRFGYIRGPLRCSSIHLASCPKLTPVKSPPPPLPSLTHRPPAVLHPSPTYTSPPLPCRLRSATRCCRRCARARGRRWLAWTASPSLIWWHEQVATGCTQVLMWTRPSMLPHKGESGTASRRGAGCSEPGPLPASRWRWAGGRRQRAPCLAALPGHPAPGLCSHWKLHMLARNVM